VPVPFTTALGSLSRHVSEREERDYQPANVTFGLMEDDDVPKIRDKAKRREAIVARALDHLRRWIEDALATPAGRRP
jgi:methylenetetrahydrofolate--tRNA-(uracil-5-)-methyltransferase